MGLNLNVVLLDLERIQDNLTVLNLNLALHGTMVRH
jgi:hypothetical protein